MQGEDSVCAKVMDIGTPRLDSTRRTTDGAKVAPPPNAYRRLEVSVPAKSG